MRRVQVSRTLDSRERSDVCDDEHQAVKVASRAPLTRGRADTETFPCQVDRSHRVISLPSQGLKLALDWPSELRWDCSVLRNPVHNSYGEMWPVGSAMRRFGEVSRAGTYFIWSPGSCR